MDNEKYIRRPFEDDMLGGKEFVLDDSLYFANFRLALGDDAPEFHGYDATGYNSLVEDYEQYTIYWKACKEKYGKYFE